MNVSVCVRVSVQQCAYATAAESIHYTYFISFLKQIFSTRSFWKRSIFILFLFLNSFQMRGRSISKFYAICCRSHAAGQYEPRFRCVSVAFTSLQVHFTFYIIQFEHVDCIKNCLQENRRRGRLVFRLHVKHTHMSYTFLFYSLQLFNVALHPRS